MKEAVFPGDKVRGVFKLPSPPSLWPAALSVVQTPHHHSTPQEGHLRVPTEPTEVRAHRRTGGFPDGKGNRVCLFPLESVRAEQCQGLGWGTKGFRQEPQRTVCSILAIRLQNALLLATSIPIWQM